MQLEVYLIQNQMICWTISNERLTNGISTLTLQVHEWTLPSVFFLLRPLLVLPEYLFWSFMKTHFAMLDDVFKQLATSNMFHHHEDVSRSADDLIAASAIVI